MRRCMTPDTLKHAGPYLLTVWSLTTHDANAIPELKYRMLSLKYRDSGASVVNNRKRYGGKSGYLSNSIFPFLQHLSPKCGAVKEPLFSPLNPNAWQKLHSTSKFPTSKYLTVLRLWLSMLHLHPMGIIACSAAALAAALLLCRISRCLWALASCSCCIWSEV